MNRLIRVIYVLLAAAVVNSRMSFAQAPSPRAAPPEPQQQRPRWMVTDPALQAIVTVEAKGRPLRVILAAVSRQCGADLRAAPELGEFRVSLHTGAQPLGTFMARLQDLFGHGRLPGSSSVWERLQEKNRAPRYILRPTPAGVHEEEALRSYPLTAAARWLRELRDYANLPPQRRAEFRSSNPLVHEYLAQNESLTEGILGPVGEAVASLTDEQLTALVTKGRVELPNFSPSPAAVARMRQATQEQPGKVSLPESRDSAALPTGAVLRFGSDTTEEGGYRVTLSFRSGFPRSYPHGIALDTLDVLSRPWDEDALEEAQQREDRPPIDLDRTLTARSVSLPEALNLLARQAGIPIYAEIFPEKPRALRFTRGKPEYLLSRLCQDFGYDWRRVGGDYLVWSKRWAEARAADVPQPLLDRWTNARRVRGRFALSDLLEMVRLSDRQLSTVQTVLGISGPLAPFNANPLRLIGTLPPAQRQAALTPAGAKLTVANDQQMQLLRRVFRRDQIVLPVQVRLQTLPEGVEIRLVDKRGAAPPGWAYLGAEPSQAERRRTSAR